MSPINQLVMNQSSYFELMMFIFKNTQLVANQASWSILSRRNIIKVWITLCSQSALTLLCFRGSLLCRTFFPARLVEKELKQASKDTLCGLFKLLGRPVIFTSAKLANMLVSDSVLSVHWLLSGFRGCRSRTPEDW